MKLHKALKLSNQLLHSCRNFMVLNLLNLSDYNDTMALVCEALN